MNVSKTATAAGFGGGKRGPNRAILAAIVPLVVLAMWFCTTGMRSGGDRPHPLPGLPTVTMRIKQSAFTLWVAVTSAQKEKGLMNIPRLSANQGMIFVFQPPQNARFWMKDTLIPLDILFLRKSGKVTNCTTMPVDNGKTIYRSRGPISFAIELKAGSIHRCGLHEGMVIKLPLRQLKAISSSASREVSRP